MNVQAKLLRRVAVALLASAVAAAAGSVTFDLSTAADKDVVFENKIPAHAQALGENPEAKHALPEQGAATGLPADRHVKSGDQELGAYTLLPYDKPNAIELATAAAAPAEQHEITVPKGRYKKIGLLVTAVDGDASFTLSIRYADGTTESGWFEADDWYDLGPRGNLTKVLRDLDRVDATTGDVEKSAHFNIYEFIFDASRGLKTDQAIESITIGNAPNRWPEDQSRYGVVFAVNGAKAD